MNKVKCPKCKEEINRIKIILTKVKTAYYDKKGNFDEDEYSYPTEEDEKWVCPECDFKLDVEDETEADEFLREKDELTEIVEEKLKQIKEKNEKRR